MLHFSVSVVQWSSYGQFMLRNKITCSTCFSDNSDKESSLLLQLAVSNSTKTALSSSLEAETLSGDNSNCCNFSCSSKATSVVPAFLEVGCYLVIQLNCFVSHDNQMIKDIKHVQYTPNISVPIKVNQVKGYNLIATMNHNETLSRGDYASFIKMFHSK